MRTDAQRETQPPDARIRLIVLRSGDYARAKRVLGAASYPAFLGRDTFQKYATNGGALLVSIDGEDVAVGIMNPRTNSLNVLGVIKRWQGQGVGAFLVNYLAPNWVRTLPQFQAYFERLGFEAIGSPRQSAVNQVQIMVRSSLRSNAGRLQRMFGAGKAGGSC